MARLGVALAALLALALLVVFAAGRGWLAPAQGAGVAQAPARDPAEVRAREQRVARAAEDVGAARPKQILFGDLHVHTTFSADAFQASLPMVRRRRRAPGRRRLRLRALLLGARLLVDQRPRRDADAAALVGDDRGDPPVQRGRRATRRIPTSSSFLGWEWTQMGTTPANHYGHKNVILRDLDDDQIPARPIPAAAARRTCRRCSRAASACGPSASSPCRTSRAAASTSPATSPTLVGPKPCPKGVPVRELPRDCRESVADAAGALRQARRVGRRRRS